MVLALDDPRRRRAVDAGFFPRSFYVASNVGANSAIAAHRSARLGQEGETGTLVRCVACVGMVHRAYPVRRGQPRCFSSLALKGANERHAAPVETALVAVHAR